MIDGLDIVTVRIQHKGCVVAGMVVPLAGFAIVSPTSGEGSSVKEPHGRLVGRLKGEMEARWYLAPIDPKLVGR